MINAFFHPTYIDESKLFLTKSEKDESNLDVIYNKKIIIQVAQ
jgi:hypothetical protein